MELSKKTTILFSPDLHEHLTYVADRKGVSLGHLIREACIERYSFVPVEEREAAVDALSSLNLPTGTPGEMKQESVPDPRELTE